MTASTPLHKWRRDFRVVLSKRARAKMSTPTSDETQETLLPKPSAPEGLEPNDPTAGAVAKGQASASRVVKVTGLAADVSESELRDLFLHCGEIVSFEWRMDLNGTSFAMVEFVDSSSAESAVLLDGTVLHGEPIHVEGVEDSSTTFSGLRKSAVLMLNMLVEKGYGIGHDMLEKAKAYDEEHKISQRTRSVMAERSKTFVEKSKQAAASVSTRCKETNEKYHISQNINEAAQKTGRAISSRYHKVKEDEHVQRAVSSVKDAWESSASWLKGQVQRMKEGPKYNQSYENPPSQ